MPGRVSSVAAFLVVLALAAACTSSDRSATVSPSSPRATAETATSTPAAREPTKPVERVAPTPAQLPAQARVPLSSDEQLTRDRLIETMSEAPAVAVVFGAITSGDASALGALFEPRLRYCEFVPDNYQPPPATADTAHLARCPVGAATYQTWSVETGVRASRAFSTEAGWRQDTTEQVLVDVLAAGVELRTAVVERYRRVRPDGSVTRGERYLLTFALGPTKLGEHPAWEIGGEPRSFRLRIEEGDQRPIDGIEFLVGPAPRPATAPDPIALPAPRVDASNAAVLSALRDIPAAAAVVDAMAGGDLEAVIGLLRWSELNCIPPPLPGKEIPEVCDALGQEPITPYRSTLIDGGTLFFASEQRVRWWLSALFAEAPPVVTSAWRLEGSWFDEGSNDRIAISFVAAPARLIERDGQLGYWGEQLDGVWIFVDPETETPISLLQFFGPDQPGEHLSSYLARGSSFSATPLAAD